eukprot:Gb_04485 [translate_table: standard]
MELQMGLKLLCLFLLASVSAIRGQSSDVFIKFQRIPRNVSSVRIATFIFSLRDNKGRDPCGNCSIRCKLDDKSSTDCSSRRISYATLTDGEHIFEVSVKTLSGVHSAQYSWKVDTLPPTASVMARPAFTNAENVSVDISFSELCTGRGGFRCSVWSACNLLVYGPGQVIPSTFRVIQSDLKYSIIVGLSTRIQFGRVILVMDRSFCTDSAGNEFQRTQNSSSIIHFDRRNVFVNLWTSIPDKLLQINNEARTIEATNNTQALKVYLDFTAPVLNSSVEIRKALQTTAGVLLPTQRKSHGNRRFGYVLKNLSNIAVVNINLETSSIISRQGTPISPTNPLTFLYDSKRPTVELRTTLAAKTRERTVPVLIQFMKPVFNFNSSSMSISGGHLKSFREVTRSAYIMELTADNDIISIEVPENRTADIAGNLNMASNLLQVRHYTVPAISVSLYSFTTAALLVTSLAAGALTVSTASLEAAGVLSRHAAGLIVADPSRNLLSMACHLQVYALSKWLAVSLPVEYHETTRGLQWIIPHLALPWERPHKHSLLANSSIPVMTYYNRMHQQITGYAQPRHTAMVLGNHSTQLFSERSHLRERKLGTNTSIFGRPLGPMEYELFFKSQGTKPVAELVLQAWNFDGWKEFKRNMFWLAIIGGGLLLGHALILLLLQLRKRRWRTERDISCGALVIPRFEIFLLILALPCMCQAAAFLIRGGSTAGIIIGVLLLSIPTAILLSVFVFISVAIIMGLLLHYKEVHQESREIHWYDDVVKRLIGPGKRAEWTWRNGSTSSFITRFGLFFENLRGPPKVMLSQIENERSKSARDRIVASDDETEDAAAPMVQKLFGILRVYYVVLDLSKRMTLGIVVGAYSTSDLSWNQILIVFSITAFQLLFLVMKKPYINRGVQIVEIISVLCEAGVFASCLVLLAKDHAAFDHRNLGFFMISLLLVSFIAQMINEWYALLKQLLRLPPRDESFILGLKMMGCGLLMLVTPQRLWQDCAWLFPTSTKERESTVTQQSQLPHRVSTADSDSTSTVASRDRVFDEPSLESSQKAKVAEGKWSRILWPESRSDELKMLRELARASFPRGREDDDSPEPDHPPSTSSGIQGKKVEGYVRDPNETVSKSMHNSAFQQSVQISDSSNRDSPTALRSRASNMEKELESIFSLK